MLIFGCAVFFLKKDMFFGVKTTSLLQGDRRSQMGPVLGRNIWLNQVTWICGKTGDFLVDSTIGFITIWENCFVIFSKHRKCKFKGIGSFARYRV